LRDINILPTWIYFLHASPERDEELLYVGVTCHLASRIDEHRDKPWWGEVAEVIAYQFPDREQALAWEARNIRGSRPNYNREVPPEPVLEPHWCWFCGWIGATIGGPDDAFDGPTWPRDEIQDCAKCHFCLKKALV
jgi:predicted GIY-YIG superfamily endonuclease